ncbi:energy transducer TonB [Methyloraptor flagellatus]|uniref:Energy transducer TonB n=1 Tax=Methyloraptor flagellatus TaxID=3162530 RepID=A0AAU7XID5_9HYPH
MPSRPRPPAYTIITDDRHECLRAASCPAASPHRPACPLAAAGRDRPRALGPCGGCALVAGAEPGSRARGRDDRGHDRGRIHGSRTSIRDDRCGARRRGSAGSARDDGSSRAGADAGRAAQARTGARPSRARAVSRRDQAGRTGTAASGARGLARAPRLRRPNRSGRPPSSWHRPCANRAFSSPRRRSRRSVGRTRRRSHAVSPETPVRPPPRSIAAAQPQAEAAAAARASYASLLAAEIARNTFFPAEARARNAAGSVGVSLTVGPSGTVTERSVIRSSGDPSLDAAALTILGRVRTPPPPGGRFSTSTNIRFHLR